MTKQLSAVERFNAENVYQLTPDLAIPAPSTRKAKEVAKAKGTEGQLRALLGEQYDAVMEVLEDVTPGAQLAILTELTEWLFECMGVRTAPKLTNRLDELKLEADAFADSLASVAAGE